MRAIQYERFGGYEELRPVEIPSPEGGDGKAVVRMSVAGVSPLDDTVRSGKLADEMVKPLPIVPGASGVGTVADPGPSRLAPGTRVLVTGFGYGVGRDGTWRDFVEADPDHLIPLPDGVDDTAAAALSTGAGYLTAYLALTEIVRLRPGQSVLAPGIGGSVGQGGVEVAMLLGASTAISTASSTAEAEDGRDAVPQGLLGQVDDLVAGGTGVDIVLDGVGAPITGAALGALAKDGSLISIGYSGGTHTTVNVTDLIWKTAHVHGFMFSLFSPGTIAAANAVLLGWLAEKKIRPVVARTFPLAEAAEAQRHLIEDRPFGRVLLTF